MPSIAEGAVVPQSWTWECDQQLRIVALCAAPDAPPVPEGWEGCSLSEVFELQPDEDGRFPVLRGLARQARFDGQRVRAAQTARSEEHTSELQSLMRISYAVFCLKKKTYQKKHTTENR